jgi:hypothetical protein
LHTPKYTLKYTLKCTSKYTSKYDLKYTPRDDFQDAPNCTRWHTLSLLDYTLPIKLLRCSQVHSKLHLMVHSQLTWLYAPKYTLNRKDTPNLTWVYDPIYAPAYSIQRLVQLQTSGTGSCRVWREDSRAQPMVSGVWLVAGGICWLKP